MIINKKNQANDAISILNNNFYIVEKRKSNFIINEIIKKFNVRRRNYFKL